MFGGGIVGECDVGGCEIGEMGMKGVTLYGGDI